MKNFYPFTNEIVFPIIMQDPERCRTFLERLFPGRKVSDLKLKNGESIPDRATPERSIITGLTSHGVRLDVLFENDEAWYDIEMQVEDGRNLAKRSRYYHSMMDQAFLKKGDDYDSLNPQYVIFICSFDPIGEGHPIYSFEMYDPKYHLPFRTESYTILLNTEADNEMIPDELRSFYGYVRSQNVDSTDDFIRDIHNEVVRLNDNDEWRRGIMTFGELLDEKYAKGLKEGAAKGRAEEKTEVARNLKDAGVPVGTIAEATGLSKEEIEKL